MVTWWQRRTAEGVPVFQHGGSWGGQNSDFFFIPDRGFAMTTLTNSTTGAKLIAEVARSGGWALGHFVGLSNPPAVPKKLSPAELAPYEGHYKGWVILPTGTPDKIEELAIDLSAADGGLRVAGDLELALAFYRDDFVLTTDPEGQVKRSDFVRAADGHVVWFRDGGRMFARQP